MGLFVRSEGDAARPGVYAVSSKYPVIIDGGDGGDGGGDTTPVATFEVYADVPSSITSSGGTVSAWGGLSQSTPSSRPVLVSSDTVDGGVSIAFSPGQSLVSATGALDFLSQGTSTIIFVWRSRKWDPRLQAALLDTSTNGATAGLQVQISDDSTNNGRFRKIRTRLSNASSFIVDEPPGVGFYNNAYIEGKWHVTAIHVSATRAALSVDGEFSYDIVEAVSMPVGTPGPLVVSGGYHDVRCLWIKQGGLSDVDTATVAATLAARFNVSMLVQVAGTTTSANQYYAFPGLIALTNGDLVTCYRAGVAHAADVGTIVMKTSTNRGQTWGNAITIQTDGTQDSRDPSLSKKLANGDYLLNFFLQHVGGNTLESCWIKRSSDECATFGTKLQVSLGRTVTTSGFEACSAPIVETAVSGRLLFPGYGKNDGQAFTSTFCVISTDNGATWPTVVTVGNGVTDSKAYSEIAFLRITTATQGLNVGDILALMRDDTNARMCESVSTNNGASWSSVTAVTQTQSAQSSGRSLTQLASGRIVWCGRPSNDGAASIMVRTAAGTWSSGQVTATVLGVQDAATTYAGLVETSPGVLTIVYGREESATAPPIGDMVCRVDFPEWQLIAQLPMSITPSSATVAAAATQQITARGALPFTYPFAATGSGSPSVSASGLYTAGASGGTDIVRVTDVNGQTSDVTITVTGGVTLPTGIDAGNLTAWWDPTQGKVLDGGGHIATWTSVDGSARVLSGSGTTPPTPATSFSGGKASIDFDGTSSQLAGPVTINTLLGASSWTIGFAFKDTGSPADSGLDFFNAPILASVTDGFFSLGTTATQIYCGQDDAGAGTPYDIVTQTGSTAHYAIAQYDAGTGKISISLDGGAFSAGTSVTALGVSVTSIILGKTSLTGKWFNGALADITIHKSKIAGANLTSLKAFLASKI